MNRLQRWNSAQPTWWNRDAFEALNRFFDDSYDRPMSEWDSTRSWNLPLDVIEKEDAYVVRASIPGLDPDDLDITFTDNVLTIQAQTKLDNEDESERYMVRERRFGSFTRSIRFPMPVDGDEVEATCKNGELMLRLPKAENARPRRISIKGDGSPRVIEAQTKSNGKNKKESNGRDSKGWTQGYAEDMKAH
ncbi:MAG: Hsp20/alpha crystallin family protein [Anaerolineae bacterium]|uniref:Hsp20/alpha crystallin family protein n=1 Tax=Promineifilum sp. TaxID=2664178 RepID=UPI001E0947BC|nr:Hsp20/alpha crystallin family protein [Anaerolineales bacterium]MCB8935966.1 Hsp20/alpha crystallin family protein [Promineifilum sp.]MCO5180093.1 Hsp20/alpha crystallin family protein [Promineifilum sp.]MCW5847452.1 Hsp20/alpha crystallin family protein [Anaerolineae bacterium]